MLEGIDLGVLYFFGGLHRPWLDVVVRAVTTLGNAPVLVGVGVAGTVLLWVLRWPRLALLFALTSLASWGVEHGVKWFVNRPRPDVAWRLIDLPNEPSFPSGHALCSMAIYGALSLILAQIARPRRGVVLGVAGVVLGAGAILMWANLDAIDFGLWYLQRGARIFAEALGGVAVVLTGAGLASLIASRDSVVVGAGGIALGIVVGLTRPYLGVHYPVDVLTGWVGGLALALTAAGLAAGIIRRQAETS